MPRLNPRTKAHYDDNDDADDDLLGETMDTQVVSPNGKDKEKGKKQKQRRDLKQLEAVLATHQQQDSTEESFLVEQERELPASTRDEQVKRRLLRRLARLKLDRKTNRECASLLGVSDRTIYNFLNDPVYLEVQQEMTSSAREDGHLRISEVITEAIDELYTIMKNGDSEFVRMKSAELLLGYAGFNEPKQVKQENSKTEYERFMRLVDEKLKMHGTPQVNISIHQSGTQVSELPAGTVVDADAPTAETDFPDLPAELQKYAITVLPGGKLPSSHIPAERPLTNEK